MLRASSCCPSVFESVISDLRGFPTRPSSFVAQLRMGEVPTRPSFFGSVGGRSRKVGVLVLRISGSRRRQVLLPRLESKMPWEGQREGGRESVARMFVRVFVRV